MGIVYSIEHIESDSKYISLGIFTEKEDAINARKKAEESYKNGV